MCFLAGCNLYFQVLRLTGLLLYLLSDSPQQIYAYILEKVLDLFVTDSSVI